jgi:hypothetical protein
MWVSAGRCCTLSVCVAKKLKAESKQQQERAKRGKITGNKRVDVAILSFS